MRSSPREEINCGFGCTIIMTDGGGDERNGRISNIMNSLWSNNGNDDTLLDTFKLVSGAWS